MMTLDEFFRDYISTWEGGLSVDPDDAGNWFTAKGCKSLLVGSNCGVTGAVLAAYRGTDLITPSDIKNLTLDEAAAIGEKLFYHVPNFDMLPWDGLVASAVDFGWGAGPAQSVKLLQRLIGCADDGQIGPFTAKAYREFITSHGLETAANLWASERDDFYRLICVKRPVNQKYLKGWMRRTAYFAPGTPWWQRFNAPDLVTA